MVAANKVTHEELAQKYLADQHSIQVALCDIDKQYEAIRAVLERLPAALEPLVGLGKRLRQIEQRLERLEQQAGG